MFLSKRRIVSLQIHILLDRCTDVTTVILSDTQSQTFSGLYLQSIMQFTTVDSPTHTPAKHTPQYPLCITDTSYTHVCTTHTHHTCTCSPYTHCTHHTNTCTHTNEKTNNLFHNWILEPLFLEWIPRTFSWRIGLLNTRFLYLLSSPAMCLHETLFMFYT